MEQRILFFIIFVLAEHVNAFLKQDEPHCFYCEQNGPALAVDAEEAKIWSFIDIEDCQARCDYSENLQIKDEI